MNGKKLSAAAAIVFALTGGAATVFNPGGKTDNIIGPVCFLLSFISFVWLIVVSGAGDDKKGS